MSAHSESQLNNDSILWTRLIKGDRDALDHIFTLLYDNLYFYGLKMCHDELRVKDAIQDVFLKVWETRKSLLEIEAPKAYIIKIFRHRIIFLSKQSLLRKRTSDKYAREKDQFVFSTEDFIISEELSQYHQQFLLNILNQLTERQREVVFLKFYGNHSNTEISEIMNMKKQSVANLLARTIQILRDASSQNSTLFTIANLYIITRL